MAESKMQAREFTDEVTTLVNELKAHFNGQLVVSDVLDDEGHQYIDIVMEGGGVLGIALVGYLYVLEQMGIRFLRIAGASAGAVSAMLLACLDEVKQPKSEKLVELLANLDLFRFVDGDKGAKRFIRFMLEDDKEEAPSFLERIADYGRLGLNTTGILDEVLQNELGLNPGVEFHKWLTEVLAGADTGVTTNAGLRNHLQKVPKLHLRGMPDEPLSKDWEEARLALVTADVSTESKVIFPKMAALYYENPDQVNPADFVRTSVSVPFFFQPFSLDSIEPQLREHPEQKAKFREMWKEEVGFDGDEKGENGWPAKHLFVDGGILSNFPIALFHNRNPKPGERPKAPTFGAKLGKDVRGSNIKKLFSLTGAIFNSSRHVLDLDFLLNNPDYRHLITEIDTGTHHWLNFELSPQAKIDLFKRGANCAAEFLKTFDWEAYKDIRGKLSDARGASIQLTQEKEQGHTRLHSLSAAQAQPVREGY